MEESRLGVHDMNGPVHRPPGSTRPYQYDGENCQQWGCSQVDYLVQWLAAVRER